MQKSPRRPPESAPSSSRREFLRAAGVTLVSLLGARHVAGCRTPTEPAAVPPTAGPDPGVSWDGVRRFWLELAARVGRPADFAADWEQQETARKQTEAEHRAALEELVQAGAVGAPVAARLQLAYEEASFHVWRTSVPVTCYDPTQLGVMLMDSREELVKRIDLLDDLVRAGEVPAEAVTESRAALERQLAVLDAAKALEALPYPERLEPENRLVDQFQAGGVEPSAEDRDAARLLVEILLGETP